MIVQTYMVILTLSVGLISDVTCTSFSNVYVESDVVPVGYYSYGIPYPAIANPRLSQINSLPSVPEYVTIHPTNAVTHGNPNPNVVRYHTPSAPIIIAPNKQEPTGYEYSYVVYDQNTGDHKAQRELSDGSVVHGEYSFLQPDGYIREVKYVADDVSGFNAVVKKFLPAAVEDNKKGTTNEHKDSPPCHEIKSESLKEGSEENSGGSHENLHKAHSNEESDDKSKKHTQHSTAKENHKHSKPKDSQEQENSKEKHHSKPKHSNEESEEKSKKHTQHSTSKENHNHSKPKESEEEISKEKQHIKSKHSKDESDEETEEKSKENHHSKSKQISEVNSSEESEEANHKKSKETVEKCKENQHKKSKKESKESEEETAEESESEESKEKYRQIPSKETKTKGSKESSGEKSEEVSHGKHKEVHELLKPTNGAVVPYKDLIKCIEAAMRRNNGVPAAIRQEHSPLTYIVLNKPC